MGAGGCYGTVNRQDQVTASDPFLRPYWPNQVKNLDWVVREASLKRRVIPNELAEVGTKIFALAGEIYAQSEFIRTAQIRVNFLSLLLRGGYEDGLFYCTGQN